MKLLLTLTVSAFVCGAAYAQPTQPQFPGAGNFPIAIANNDVLVRSLFDGGLQYDDYNCRNGCAVELQAHKQWIDARGQTHLGLVMAATVRNPSHAEGAILSIADLKQMPAGWAIAAGTPELAREGTFGEPPEMQAIVTRAFGMALITEPSSTNQGETDSIWNLYLNLTGSAYKRVITVPATLDRSGACGINGACRAEDFKTDTNVRDNALGLRVQMTRRYFDGRTTTRTICISPETKSILDCSGNAVSIASPP